MIIIIINAVHHSRCSPHRILTPRVKVPTQRDTTAHISAHTPHIDLTSITAIDRTMYSGHTLTLLCLLATHLPYSIYNYYITNKKQ